VSQLNLVFEAGNNTENLRWICRSALEKISPDFNNAAIDVCFYPYIGLTHTIRRKGKTWIVRVSDHCSQAPSAVLEAIIMILGYKVMRRRTPVKFLRIYNEYRCLPEVEAAANARRQRKGRKQFAAHEGRHHSLPEIYREVNRRFFNDQIEIQQIGWSLRRSIEHLGHYDPAHHTIMLSPVLDSPKVPSFVVHFIVYHEMLHAIFENTPVSGKHRYHPPEFRRTERAHPDFARVRKFLREFAKK